MDTSEYRATLDRLFRRRRFGMRPGLEVVRALLERLDHPERSFRAIHVAGSKGKGSVAAMSAALLHASGRRVGLFTSPHLQSFRERIQVGRAPIPPSAVVDGVARVEAVADALERSGAIDRAPTFFELTTVLAFDWFRAAGLRDAVIEVGLGGRLDSTNVLNAPVGVVTTIELEHTEVLGPTLTDVAREKAGIFHPGMHGVVGEPKPEPRRELERAARAAGVPLLHLGEEVRVVTRALSDKGQRLVLSTPHREVARIDLPLFGTFQPGNAALALAATELYLAATGGRLTDAHVRRGFAEVEWRGRVERVARRPDLFLDAAHTPESAVALAQSLAEISPFAAPEENVVVFGCLADKSVAPILDALAPLAHTLVLVPVRSERAADVEGLRRSAVGRFRRIVLAPDAARGIALARGATAVDGFTLVAGSDYLVGEALTSLGAVPPDEPDLSDPAAEPPSVPHRRRVPRRSAS
jgi:dihydrofolate synthase / folylpolyglutamate synthase